MVIKLPSNQMTLTELRSRLTDAIYSVQVGNPVTVTRYARREPVAVLVPVERYRELLLAEKAARGKESVYRKVNR